METGQILDLSNSEPQLSSPIFIKSILNYRNVCNVIKKIISPEKFIYKSHINNLKLQTKTPDSYRKIIKLLKEIEVSFHTYQVK